MSETLYRKYRPKNFANIVGQKHIVTTLSNSIKNNRISHAYLFTGPRGTGKTSIARLFAKAINCTERDNFSIADEVTCKAFSDGSAVDLIEIDAASHTGVDNIRELRETITLTPTSAPFKVYIIDEVHMLSTGAFNALLKTLEEPPAHAIFVLATTEIHKVPATIISRCQRYDFSHISISDIITKLKFILNSENIDFEEEALEMIAISSNGGLRDAESLLAQTLSFINSSLTKEAVSKVLGITSQEQVISFIEQITLNNTEQAIKIVNEVAIKGYNLEIFLTSILTSLRALLLYSLNPKENVEIYIKLLTSEKEILRNIAKNTESNKIIKAIEELEDAKIKITSSVIPQLPIEIAIVKILAANFKIDVITEPITTKIEKRVNKKDLPLKNKEIDKNLVTNFNTSEEMQNSPIQKTNIQIQQSTEKQITLDFIKNNWSKLIDCTKKDNISISSLLTQAYATKLEGNQLILAVRYQLHKDKLLENKNKLTIEKAFATIISVPIMIDVIVVSEEKFHSLSPSELLSRAADIMGGTHIIPDNDESN